MGGYRVGSIIVNTTPKKIPDVMLWLTLRERAQFGKQDKSKRIMWILACSRGQESAIISQDMIKVWGSLNCLIWKDVMPRVDNAKVRGTLIIPNKGRQFRQ